MVKSKSRGEFKYDFFSFFEKVFVFFALFFSINALVPLFTSERYEVFSVGNPVTGGILVFIYAISFLLIVLRKDFFSVFISVLRKNKFLIFFLAFLSVSVLWSGSPIITLIRLFWLFGATIFGFFIYYRYSLNEQVQILAYTFGFITVLNLVFWLFFPEYALFDPYEGIWSGIFLYKNELGRASLLGLSIFLISFLSDKKNLAVRFGKLFLIFTALVFMFLSKSATSFVGLVLILMVLVFYYVLKLNSRAKRILLTVFALLLILSLFIGIIYFKDLLGFMGKDSTLTGRTEIWTAVWGKFIERPVFGYGYYAFWTGLDGPAGVVYSKIAKSYGDSIQYAHNGFLDILLDVGIVGLILFLIHFIINVKRAIRLSFYGKRVYDLFPLIYLLFFFTYNLTSTLIAHSTIFFWIIYIVVSFNLSEKTGR